jgi:hypothetical protein
MGLILASLSTIKPSSSVTSTQAQAVVLQSDVPPSAFREILRLRLASQILSTAQGSLQLNSPMLLALRGLTSKLTIVQPRGGALKVRHTSGLMFLLKLKVGCGPLLALDRQVYVIPFSKLSKITSQDPWDSTESRFQRWEKSRAQAMKMKHGCDMFFQATSIAFRTISTFSPAERWCSHAIEARNSFPQSLNSMTAATTD